MCTGTRPQLEHALALTTRAGGSIADGDGGDDDDDDDNDDGGGGGGDDDDDDDDDVGGDDDGDDDAVVAAAADGNNDDDADAVSEAGNIDDRQSTLRGLSFLRASPSPFPASSLLLASSV